MEEITTNRMEETLEQLQSRHRKEQRDLVSRITQKKKNATKKTRKGVNDECADLERQLKNRHDEELRALTSPPNGAPSEPESEDETPDDPTSEPEPEPTTDLSTKLASTTLSPSPQPKPKNRNRQKDRLARRQAEIIAASETAAAEAANMTDHRSLEKSRMEPIFLSHNLLEREVAPDGHCLFASFADGLASNSIPLTPDATPSVAPYKIVRQTAARYMVEHGDDFAGFLEEPLEVYVAKIADTAEWGGQLELTALANAYGVEVRVVQDGRTEVIAPTGEEGGEERKVVWLAYYRHGYGLGEHYNSLRRKEGDK
jgi:OTU domain-containing protein 6